FLRDFGLLDHNVAASRGRAERARQHKGVLHPPRLPDPAAVLPDTRRVHHPHRPPPPAGRRVVGVAFASVVPDLPERPDTWSVGLRPVLVTGDRGEVLPSVAVVDVRDNLSPEEQAGRGRWSCGGDSAGEPLALHRLLRYLYAHLAGLRRGPGTRRPRALPA